MDKELHLFFKERSIFMKQNNLEYEKIPCNYLYLCFIHFNINTKLNFKNFKKYLDNFIISINDENIIYITKTQKYKKHKSYCINYKLLLNMVC